MAGSLQRPPFKIIIPLRKCNTSNNKNLTKIKYNTNKSILKYQKLSLLHKRRRQQQQHQQHQQQLQENCDKISKSNNYQNSQQFQQLKQLKKLKYCQSLSWHKLLLLLPPSLSTALSPLTTTTKTLPSLLSKSLSNDSCWTATENKKKFQKNFTATTAAAINYVQQQQKQQQELQEQQHHQHQQQLQLQLLQILSKVFKSSKFCKNLLNRKKLQLREIQFYRENQLHEKIF